MKNQISMFGNTCVIHSNRLMCVLDYEKKQKKIATEKMPKNNKDCIALGTVLHL